MLQELPPARDMGRSLCHRSGVGSAATIVQACRLDVPHLSLDQPGLVHVLCGRKRVSDRRTPMVFETGAMALFSGGSVMDVVNEPAGDGPYRAEAIFFDAGDLPDIPPPGTHAVEGIAAIATPDAGLCQALAAAGDAIADPSLPDAVARHRVHELLLWLGAAGHAIVAPRKTDIVTRIRALVARDAAAKWKAADIAQTVAMSEASLRRRLSERGTSLSALVLDVRLSMALTLLQATEQTVSSVAYTVGYDSPSRFAARFRQRFGFAPSDIRDRLS